MTHTKIGTRTCLKQFLQLTPLHHTDTQLDTQSKQSDIVTDIVQTHTKLRSHVSKHLTQYTDDMKEYYDKNRTPVQLEKGQIVFVKEPPQVTDNPKFAPLFHGPYIVTEVLPHSRVSLTHLHSGTPYSHPLHFSRLKLASHYDKEVAYRDM